MREHLRECVSGRGVKSQNVGCGAQHFFVDMYFQHAHGNDNNCACFTTLVDCSDQANRAWNAVVNVYAMPALSDYLDEEIAKGVAAFKIRV